ncbi:DUF4179 domain-containing protein [Paenibacillus sp. FSL H8-0259]|uniref:DUF4179 domain-containing protein n=1 Tax=Paenibacillus sp. FSL H8-0259 TaxID=1920423 RepID=UPI00096C81D8|nr:DUF4179 domain-containing protein [Paenibacillus sp. FSL H8-0259]OMF26049.1 hypothetical protein BK132_20915 [Paenibacillus sp. FSL H8-0259]
MSQQPLESRLEGLKEERLPELPEVVHTRMEKTYRMIVERDEASLEETPDKDISKHRSKRSCLSRVIISAASVAAGLGIIISLGFISPAMAETLKQLPFMESVFNLVGDAGLQKANKAGLTTNIQQSVTQDGTTITVSEQMYDGSRLSLVLTRAQADGGDKGKWLDLTRMGEEAGGINNIEFRINGKSVNTGNAMASGGTGAPDSVIVTALSGVNLQLPEQFDLTMLVSINGIDQPFRFEFPVSKNTLGDLVLVPGEVKVHDHIHLRVTRLELSQTSTRLLTEVTGDPGADIKAIEEAIPDKYKQQGSFIFWFELWNGQGQEAVMVDGSSSGNGHTISQSSVFEPFEKRPESIIIKPYVWKDGHKLYIPELEITVPVK